MREIKFRAWDKKLHQMEEVFAIDFVNKRVLCHPDYDDWRPFEQIELLQYTGLKDKEGQEIYEGDKIDVAGAEKIIKFYKGAFRIFYPDEYEDFDHFPPLKYNWNIYVKVKNGGQT